MSTLLEGLMISGGNSIYHSAEYMRYIDNHVNYLKQNGGAVVDVDPGLVHKFEYNFFSLLVELKYEFEDFVVLLIVNGFKSPTDMTREFRQLIVPNPEVLTNLKQLFRHQNKRI